MSQIMTYRCDLTHGEAPNMIYYTTDTFQTASEFSSDIET